MSNPWALEIARLLVFAAAATAVGWALGHAALVVALVLLLYLAWHALSVYRLESWLRQGGKGEAPRLSGFWGEIFGHFQRLQHRNRKRKRKLAQYLKRFRQSTEAMPDATVVLRADTEIEWFNSAARRLLGLRPQQDLGRRICDLLPESKFAAYLEQGNFDEAVEFTSPVDRDQRLSVRIIPYGKNQRLLVARDVTRLHRLETLRRDFVANVSHELRTPLTVITGYLETLVDLGAAEPRNGNLPFLESMQEQAARMERLLEDLLLLSRLETTDRKASIREAVAVPAILATIAEDARMISAGRHEIRFQVDDRLWLDGNAEQLRSAFTNLVHNAVRYTPAGGRIEVNWAGDEQGATFSVADTGIGIPAEHLPRLTERFYRVDVGRSRQNGGTGLGLAIVKHVLNHHDGELHIQSELKRGSEFSCRFPAERVIAREHEAPPVLHEVMGFR